MIFMERINTILDNYETSGKIKIVTQIFIKTGVWAVSFLFLSGCMASTSKMVQPALEKKNEAVSKFSEKVPNGYYYFVEAQLQAKKGNSPAAVKYLVKAIGDDPDSLVLQKELGRLYLDLGEKEKALELANKILAVDPDNLEALIMYGRINQMLKHFDMAAKAYERVLGIDPLKQRVYLLLGGIYLDSGDLQGALRIFKSLVDHFEDAYVGYFFLGKVFVAQGNVIEAEKNFKKSLSLEPRLEEPRFELLNVYKDAGSKGKILDTYLEILKQNPDNARASLELAYFYDQEGQPGKAADILRELGRKSLTDTNIIRKVVQLYLEPERYKTLLVLIKGMLDGAPHSSDLHYVAAMAYGGVKNEDGAMLHYSQVEKASRFYQSAAIHVSILYHRKGEIKKAAAYLEAVLENIPPNIDILMYLASFYEDLEAYPRAEQTLDRALEMDAANVDLNFRLGVIYDKAGQKEKSIHQMKRVIELDPENANALNYLGYTYADLGRNMDEAERLILQALKYKPGDGYITDSLGWVYFKKGLFEKALKYLEKAVSIVPDDPIVLEHLGDAFRAQNNPEKALDAYRRSLLNNNKDKATLEKKIRELTGPES